jgi:UDP-GlcNAc:undecaprenyl-phosphate GlcNAc-1-phosphate transferase
MRWLIQRIPAWTILAVGLGTAIYSLRVAMMAQPVPADIGWLCLALAMLLVAIGLVSRVRPLPDWMMQGVLYVGAVVLVYLDATTPSRALPTGIEVLATFLMAGTVMLYFRMTTVRRFRLTPLDFLVVFVALVLPNLPGSIVAPRDLGLAAVKLLVVFYAVEMLTGHSRTSRTAYLIVATVSLAIVAISAL